MSEFWALLKVWALGGRPLCPPSEPGLLCTVEFVVPEGLLSLDFNTPRPYPPRPNPKPTINYNFIQIYLIKFMQVSSAPIFHQLD